MAAFLAEHPEAMKRDGYSRMLSGFASDQIVRKRLLPRGARIVVHRIGSSNRVVPLIATNKHDIYERKVDILRSQINKIKILIRECDGDFLPIA